MTTNNEFKDILKVEGILFKGFGHIPKFIMLDTDLSLESKAIYAYFCSFTGSGNSAFPSRDRILKDLKITKDYYYKHYKPLINNGYIFVERERQKDEQTGQTYLGRNIYTLVANPKKFTEQIQDQGAEQTRYSRIRISGMKALGYGTIAKAVMLDDRLTLKSKGIYAYFCSFAGSGNSAFPKRDNILYHLQISENTYYKHFNLLTKYNYITTVQRKINGSFSINDYYINETPDEELVENIPYLKIQDIDKTIGDTRFSPYLKIQDITKLLKIQRFHRTSKYRT